MNFPKRTQEIATTLCQLLDGDTELSRKVVGHLKEAETECSRTWHTYRLSTRKCYQDCPPPWLRGYGPGHIQGAERWDSLVDQLQQWGRLRMDPNNFSWVSNFIQLTAKAKDLSIADRLDIINGLCEF